MKVNMDLQEPPIARARHIMFAQVRGSGEYGLKVDEHVKFVLIVRIYLNACTQLHHGKKWFDSGVRVTAMYPLTASHIPLYQYRYL